MGDPVITKAEIHEIEYTQTGLEPDAERFNLVYRKGASRTARAWILNICTDAGITGEYIIRRSITAAAIRELWPYLKGKNALQRERVFNDMNRGLRHAAGIGVGPVDNALWDIAGKFHGVPVRRLLGGWKESLPCYASTYHGDHNGGLDSPQAYAEFALRCREIGYPAFKIHGWPDGNVSREVAAIKALREAVGDEMDLMLDPACELETFADTLQVGRACDEARFYWLEDPYRDCGRSQFGHRKLRQLISTPLLITEHVRGVEQHIDFALADATDFVRGDVDFNGITGTMKIAHACETLGIDIQMHDTGPAVRQCIAAIRNTKYYELALVHPMKEVSSLLPEGIYAEYSDELDAVDRNGEVPVPGCPGLGAPIDMDVVKHHEVSVEEMD